MSRVVPEIPTSVWLNVADINQPIESMAPGGPADWTGHSEIHCLRVGYTLGELLRDGPTPHEMSYISTLVLPQWCDEGEPTPERYLFDMLRQHSDDLQQVGWRLDKVDVQLDPAVKLITGPHFIVSLHMSADRFPFTWHAYPSPMSKDTLTPSWTSNFILANGQSGLLSLRSGIDGKSLGTFHFAAGDQPPSTLNADPSTGQFWSASLEWTPVHF
jgi:hypothetical protein